VEGHQCRISTQQARNHQAVLICIVLSECYKSVRRVLQECCKNATRLLQRFYRGVTGVLQGCYRGATGILPRYSYTTKSTIVGCSPPPNLRSGTRVLHNSRSVTFSFLLCCVTTMCYVMLCCTMQFPPVQEIWHTSSAPGSLSPCMPAAQNKHDIYHDGVHLFNSIIVIVNGNTNTQLHTHTHTHYRGVTGVLQGYNKGVTGVLQGCYRGVLDYTHTHTHKRTHTHAQTLSLSHTHTHTY
jgi:hypothetical protein